MPFCGRSIRALPRSLTGRSDESFARDELEKSRHTDTDATATTMMKILSRRHFPAYRAGQVFIIVSPSGLRWGFCDKAVLRFCVACRTGQDLRKRKAKPA